MIARQKPGSTLLQGVMSLLFLLCLIPVSGAGANLYTLYPPTGLVAEGIECVTYLSWQKPVQPGGMMPPGLLGYNIYRDGVMIHFNDSAELLTYYDYDVEWGTYSYAVKAYYDLSYYGFPGEFGESAQAGPVIINLNCDVSLPFIESWDLGSFVFQNWKFFPSQGNWFIDTGFGNPLPAAGFRGNPALTNYNVLMQGPKLDGRIWDCATFFLEFDLKLHDSLGTGTETLCAECYYDSTWHTVASFSNNGSTGWEHYKVEVPELSGRIHRIGFRASGVHSANINRWYIDNIMLHGECYPPTACAVIRQVNEVILTWQPPVCDSLSMVAGYNVYRSHIAQGPFMKLNSSLINTFQYHDVLPSGFPYPKLWYIITDVQKSPVNGEVLCEAGCDTLEFDLSLGGDAFPRNRSGITVQTLEGILYVRSDVYVDSYALYDTTGKRVDWADLVGNREFRIPSGRYSTGIYLLQLVRRDGAFSFKVQINN